MLSLINKKAVQAIFISDEVDFRAKNITRYKEYHFIMIKESVHENHITILNVYVLNNRASKQIKKKRIELQGKIDKSIIKIRDFNIPLSIIDR